MSYPDGTREAVMLVAKLKDGKIVHMETGATSLDYQVHAIFLFNQKMHWHVPGDHSTKHSHLDNALTCSRRSQH